MGVLPTGLAEKEQEVLNHPFLKNAFRFSDNDRNFRISSVQKNVYKKHETVVERVKEHLARHGRWPSEETDATLYSLIRKHLSDNTKHAKTLKGMKDQCEKNDDEDNE